jgi:hypothetical protein
MPRGGFMGNATVIGLLLMSSILCLWAQDGATKARDARLIRQVQETSASQLDSALPPVSFEKWLHVEAGADAEFHWEVNNCGQKTGTIAEHGARPPDVRRSSSRYKGPAHHRGEYVVGTFKKGASGKPNVNFIQLVTPSTTVNSHHLSDIPAAMIRTHVPPPVEIAK